MTADEKLQRYVVPNYGRYPIWPVRANGTEVWDRDGKRYLDFAGGVAVCPVGHAHPAIVEALSKQASTLIHVSNWYCIEGQAHLAERLVNEVVEIEGKCFFCNSGAEANEGLLKLARRYGVQQRGLKAPKIITFTNSFHGRTLGAMFATAQSKIWGDFGLEPAELGYIHLPFNDTSALKSVFSQHSDIVAVLLEPIQGESGVNAVTADFLRTAQSLCRAHNALLLLDEVQCGFGRAGHLSGWRAIIPGDEIQPDGISWAKAMGSGYPLGAFWVRDAAMPNGGKLCDLLGPGSHGTTYGGSPLACAVGLATVDTIINEDLCGNAEMVGNFIRTEATAWKHPLITTIRQKGLFIGFELEADSIKRAAGEKAPSIFLAGLLLNAGLMTVPAGPNVVRWLPPLNISKQDAIEALSIMRAVLDEVSTPMP